MNAGPIKKAATYVGGLSLIVFFVLLLSFIFSFLGTIFCAVLAGMMLGATSQVKWHAVPLSIVFPGVIFGLLRESKAEMSQSQVTIISLLCFGAFWLAFVAASALMSFERKGQPAGGAHAAQHSSTRHQKSSAAETDKLAVSPSADVGSRSSRMTLDILQGRWNREPATQESQHGQRLMEIREQNLTIRTVNGKGEVTFMATAEVQVEKNGGEEKMIVRETWEAGSDFLVSI